MSRKFDAKVLKQVIMEDGPDGYEWLAEIEGYRGRWTVSVTTIFSFEGKTYGVDWRRANTEMQDNEYPGGYGENEVECDEYALVEKTVKVWELVK